MSDESFQNEAEPSKVDLNDFKDFQEKIAIKFYTNDEANLFTHSFHMLNSIDIVKRLFVSIFNIAYEDIGIQQENVELRDKDILGNLKTDEFGILHLKAVSKDPFCIEKIYEDFVVPDIITVKVEDGDDSKEVVVEIENRTVAQPKLGGYKNTKTGVNYFNNFTQTGPPKSKVPNEMKSNRDTQTYVLRNRRTDMEYSRATQMFTTDHYIPSITDRIVTPGPYETAEEMEKRRDVEGKVRTIQRYYRGWRMRTELKKLHEEYQKRIRLELEEDERERQEDAARRRRGIVSTVFPITKTDFAMLYNMTERWKKAEIARITSLHCGPSKIAEFYLLLEKEIEILLNIDKLKHKVSNDLQVKQKMNFFKNICDPIEWYSSYKNIHIEMDTLETQKGREYFSLYKRLCDKVLDKEERLNVYMEIKEYLNKHVCNESEMIRRLIDRICLMMARGMEDKYISGLEKRIENLVLHHFKLDECNEGVTNHIRKVQKKKIEKDLLYCSRCERLKPIESFSINARTAKVKNCSHCTWLDKTEEPWMNLLPYRFILKQIRNYERRHRATSSIAFILHDKDIHYIVNQIWHGHSAMSECNDIYELRLCRWRVEKQWSPWNCILLTMQEAKCHLSITELREVYEDEFINHVFNKHALARQHFAKLIVYDRYFAKISEGDQRLDDDSEFYNKPKPDCPFGEMK